MPGSIGDMRTWLQNGTVDVVILPESTAAQVISEGWAVGICNSVANRDLYTESMEPLMSVPILTEIDGIKEEDVEGLICNWPMAIYVPASVSSEQCQWLNELCATICDNTNYMSRIKALGSTNTYQVFSLIELFRIHQNSNAQIRRVFEAFN